MATDWIDDLQRKIDRLTPAQRRRRADKLGRKMASQTMVSVPQMVEVVVLCNPISCREVAEKIRASMLTGELQATMMH